MARLPLYRCRCSDDRLYNTKRLAVRHVESERRYPTGDPGECAISGVAECDRCGTDLRNRVPACGSDKPGGTVHIRKGRVYCARVCKMLDFAEGITRGGRA